MPSISGPTTVTEDDEDVTWTASGGTYDDLADWSYSDPQGILGVDGYGGNTFTAAKFYGTGTFTITVRNDQGETASLTVTVTEADPEPDPIYVTSVSLSTSSVSVANGSKALADYIHKIESSKDGAAVKDPRALAEELRKTKGYGG